MLDVILREVQNTTDVSRQLQEKIKYIETQNRFYCCFVDLGKARDGIPRYM